MTFGRPQEYDRIKIGNDMVKWATENPTALTIPMFATSIGMHSEMLRTWCKTDEAFRSLYMRAKEILGVNRLKCTQPDSEFIMSDSLYRGTLHHYDYDIKADIREEKEFESSLKKDEAGVPHTNITLMVPNDLAIGSDVPTQTLSSKLSSST